MKVAEQPIKSLLDVNEDQSIHFISTGDLTLLDRCDSCNAAAFVRAKKSDAELLFCGNHGRRHLTSLMEQGWRIDDQTFRAFDEKTIGSSH